MENNELEEKLTEAVRSKLTQIQEYLNNGEDDSGICRRFFQEEWKRGVMTSTRLAGIYQRITGQGLGSHPLLEGADNEDLVLGESTGKRYVHGIDLEQYRGRDVPDEIVRLVLDDIRRSV